MSIQTAIVPHFRNVAFRNQLFNGIPTSGAMIGLDESKRTSLREEICSKSRIEIIQSTLNQTVDKINDAFVLDHWYYIDLSVYGKIHDTFITHYANLLVNALELQLPQERDLPIHWQDDNGKYGTRYIDCQTFEWD